MATQQQKEGALRNERGMSGVDVRGYPAEHWNQPRSQAGQVQSGEESEYQATHDSYALDEEHKDTVSTRGRESWDHNHHKRFAWLSWSRSVLEIGGKSAGSL